jgi:hypothetical protein
MRTDPGRRLRGKLGTRMARAASGDQKAPPGTTASEDYQFLLERCEGDEAELERRLEAETRRNPDLGDGEVYRRAIRTWFLEKRGGTHGAIAEELDDTWL